MRPLLSIVPVRSRPKDIGPGAPPERHHAWAGSHRPCGPRRLSQRPSLSHGPRCPKDPLAGRGLGGFVPRVRPSGLASVAAGAGDAPAIAGKRGGSPSGGGRPGAHRLEVSPESRVDGPWLRLFGPE